MIYLHYLASLFSLNCVRDPGQEHICVHSLFGGHCLCSHVGWSCSLSIETASGQIRHRIYFLAGNFDISVGMKAGLQG